MNEIKVIRRDANTNNFTTAPDAARLTPMAQPKPNQPAANESVIKHFTQHAGGAKGTSKK